MPNNLRLFARLSIADWIKIILLIFAIIGGFVNFEWRVRTLESNLYRAENVHLLINERMDKLESKESVQFQFSNFKENINSQLNDIREHLSKMEHKLDRIR